MILFYFENAQAKENSNEISSNEPNVEILVADNEDKELKEENKKMCKQAIRQVLGYEDYIKKYFNGISLVDKILDFEKRYPSSYIDYQYFFEFIKRKKCIKPVVSTRKKGAARGNN